MQEKGKKNLHFMYIYACIFSRVLVNMNLGVITSYYKCFFISAELFFVKYFNMWRNHSGKSMLSLCIV